MHFKSIKTRILINVIVSMAVITLTISGVGVYLMYSSTMTTLEKTMVELAKQAASVIQSDSEKLKLMAEDMGCIARIAKADTSPEQLRAISQERQGMYGTKDIYVVDLQGKGVSHITNATIDISARNYFKQAAGGVSTLSEPLENVATGELDVIAAAPLWENGTYDTKVIGVIALAFDGDELSNIVRNVTVGKTGTAFLIDKNATTIAHVDYERVRTHENIIKASSSNPALKVLADMEKEMMAGKSGFLSYSFAGVGKVAAFAPIPGSDNWSIAATAAQDEFAAAAGSAAIIMLIVGLIGLIVTAILALLMSNSIAKPIKQCVNRLALLSEGDLTTPVPVATNHDETGTLLNSTKTTVDSINAIIGDMIGHLGKMANGDLRSAVEHVYAKDYAPLKTAMEQILLSFNKAMSGIDQAAEEVESGASHVSAGAQALSQGATEQASSVEELCATLNDVAAQIKKNASDAIEARKEAEASGTMLASSNDQMNEMSAAIVAISEKSGEIGKIIKTIEDIAFQTNILALNAAVEAARAGNAGKGFAVVADEVRNLAGKSANAAKNTTALIEQTIQAVENGTRIASDTAASMAAVVESATAVVNLIERIASASSAQSDAIQQLTLGVDQISNVVQMNSATAEESAAASEELSGQSETLKSLVNRFSLKDR